MIILSFGKKTLFAGGLYLRFWGVSFGPSGKRWCIGIQYWTVDKSYYYGAKPGDL